MSASSAAPFALRPLVFACRTCRTRFPHRYGWRKTVTTFGFSTLWCDIKAEPFWALLGLPLALIFAAAWVPMEMAAPPCPLCGHGVIRRDHG